MLTCLEFACFWPNLSKEQLVYGSEKYVCLSMQLSVAVLKPVWSISWYCSLYALNQFEYCTFYYTKSKNKKCSNNNFPTYIKHNVKLCNLVKQYVIERLPKGCFQKRSVNIHMTEYRAWSYVIIKISTVITIPVTIIFRINITGTLCTFNAAHR